MQADENKKFSHEKFEYRVSFQYRLPVGVGGGGDIELLNTEKKK